MMSYDHTNEQLTFEVADKLIATSTMPGTKEAWAKLRPAIRLEDTIWKHVLRSGINRCIELIVMREGEIVGRIPIEVDR